MISINSIDNPDEKSSICRDILYRLPDWFGIPESTEEYIENVRGMLFYAACLDDDDGGEAAGFMALEAHNESSAEIHVMGVREEAHRLGIGRALADEAADFCARTGRSFLLVKTLADSHPDVYYARTRAFYRAMGFLPLEVLEGYWDEANPCLLMCKYVGG